MLEQLQGPQHYLEGERCFLSPVIKRGTQASLLLHQWPRGCHVLTGSGLEYRNQWHVNQGHSPEAGGWVSPLQIPRLLWHSGRVERRRRSPPQARTWLLWDSKDLALQILWGLGGREGCFFSKQTYCYPSLQELATLKWSFNLCVCVCAQKAPTWPEVASGWRAPRLDFALRLLPWSAVFCSFAYFCH